MKPFTLLVLNSSSGPVNGLLLLQIPGWPFHACKSSMGAPSTPSPFPQSLRQRRPPFLNTSNSSPLFNQTTKMGSIHPTHSLRNASPPWEQPLITRTSRPHTSNRNIVHSLFHPIHVGYLIHDTTCWYRGNKPNPIAPSPLHEKNKGWKRRILSIFLLFARENPSEPGAVSLLPIVWLN